MCDMIPPDMICSEVSHDPSRRCSVAGCCRVLQCVAVCCSVFQCVAVCCSVLQSNHNRGMISAVFCNVLPCVDVCCRAFQPK